MENKLKSMEEHKAHYYSPILGEGVNGVGGKSLDYSRGRMGRVMRAWKGTPREHVRRGVMEV